LIAPLRPYISKSVQEMCMSELAGGCLCGAIQYLVAAEPIMSGACHCRDCQYVSGGAPAYAMLFAKAAFKLTKGTPRAFWSVSERGNRVARSFCEVCGTPLFAENATRPEFIAIKVGSLSDPSVFKPAWHIWTRSAQSWHAVDPALPRWEQDPEMISRVPSV
jgi:hypothetical protein